MADVEQGNAIDAATDVASVDAIIGQLHADNLALNARITGLKI